MKNLPFLKGSLLSRWNYPRRGIVTYTKKDMTWILRMNFISLYQYSIACTEVNGKTPIDCNGRWVSQQEFLYMSLNALILVAVEKIFQSKKMYLILKLCWGWSGAICQSYRWVKNWHLCETLTSPSLLILSVDLYNSTHPEECWSIPMYPSVSL